MLASTVSTLIVQNKTGSVFQNVGKGKKRSGGGKGQRWEQMGCIKNGWNVFRT